MQTATPTQEDISQLIQQREQITLTILEKEAKRLQQSQQFFTLGISTPRSERTQLDLEIAELSVQRQQAKMAFAQMKKTAQGHRVASLVTGLIAVLESNGLAHEVEGVRRKADADLDRAGLGDVYKAKS